MSIATTTPAVTLSNITTLDDEALLVEYRNAKSAGDTHQANRHFNAITERVKPTVTATANKVIFDASDRDIAVWTAIGKLAMDDNAFNKVLAAVRNGKALANCVARFITPKNMATELDEGRYLSAGGNTKANVKPERKLVVTDFTADETMRTVSGTSYNMDALEDALDAALFDAPTAADEACNWFRETTNGHLTTDGQEVLLHSSGITREVDDYLDDLAITDPARAARAFNAVNPNPKNAARRIGPARLSQEHVGNIVGHDQQWVSGTIDSAENAIFAKPALTCELRGGSDGTRRVTLEDITSKTIEWLKTFAYQAGIVLDEEVVRTNIPRSYWDTVMAEYHYTVDEYSDEVIAGIIDAVIAGVVA